MRRRETVALPEALSRHLRSRRHGGTFTRIDPDQDLVAAYFEVTLHVNEKMEQLGNADLVQDVIAAAVDD